ncbi:MAG: hypothetical protein ACXW2T_03535 [Allosphingosinicella sp.]
MKLSILVMALAWSAAPAAAQTTVDVGTGDWSRIPEVQPRGYSRMADAQMDLIEQIAQQGRCNVPGLAPQAVDISVPFLIRYGANGAIERIVLQDLHCPELEIALGAAVLHLARADEYRPRGNTVPGWYRSEIAFANQ